jgi:hypothetical protein
MWWPFAVAAIAYLLFRLWYDGVRGPLTSAEIDDGLARIAARGGSQGTDTAAFRTFLEADDGREFVMLNLVKFTSGMATHPGTGEQVPARSLMAHYSRHFIRRLMQRGGHPALVARKVGPYVDAWGDVQPDPGWSIMGYMRYRSRRDLLALAADPSFGPLHAYKALGTATTLSFPTQRVLALYVGPRLWVALVLLLAAALGALALG